MDQISQTPIYYIVRLRQINVVDKEASPILLHKNLLRTNYLPSNLDAFFTLYEDAKAFAEDQVPAILLGLGGNWILNDVIVEILAINFVTRGEATRSVKWD